MKNKNQTTTVLMALAYLLDRQQLTSEQLKDIIIKTAEEIEHDS